MKKIFIIISLVIFCLSSTPLFLEAIATSESKGTLHYKIAKLNKNMTIEQKKKILTNFLEDYVFTAYKRNKNETKYTVSRFVNSLEWEHITDNLPFVWYRLLEKYPNVYFVDYEWASCVYNEELLLKVERILDYIQSLNSSSDIKLNYIAKVIKSNGLKKDFSPIFYKTLVNDKYKYIIHYLAEYAYNENLFSEALRLSEIMLNRGFTPPQIYSILESLKTETFKAGNIVISPEFENILMNKNYSPLIVCALKMHKDDLNELNNYRAIVDKLIFQGYSNRDIEDILNATRYITQYHKNINTILDVFLPLQLSSDYYNTIFYKKDIFENQVKFKNALKLVKILSASGVPKDKILQVYEAVDFYDYVDFEKRIPIIINLCQFDFSNAYFLQYIDWNKIENDLAPTFYTILKNKDFEEYTRLAVFAHNDEKIKIVFQILLLCKPYIDFTNFPPDLIEKKFENISETAISDCQKIIEMLIKNSEENKSNLFNMTKLLIIDNKDNTYIDSVLSIVDWSKTKETLFVLELMSKNNYSNAEICYYLNWCRNRYYEIQKDDSIIDKRTEFYNSLKIRIEADNKRIAKDSIGEILLLPQHLMGLFFITP